METESIYTDIYMQQMYIQSTMIKQVIKASITVSPVFWQKSKLLRKKDSPDLFSALYGGRMLYLLWNISNVNPFELI